jgi:hypothetical protein
VSLGVTVLLLGPLLGPGVTLRYDMAWAPIPTFTPWVLGVGVVAPRAVPSDAFAVLVGQVVGADLAQSAVLAGALMALGVGAAALLLEVRPGASALARCAAVVGSVWSLFVVERLAVGHWPVLLGAAAVPWGLRAALRLRRGAPGWAGLTTALLLAGLGGANGLLATVPPVLVALLWPPAQVRAAAAAVVVATGACAVWALPALVFRPTAARDSVDAFAPRADGALGVMGAVLSGGGLWNPVSHPAELSVPWLAAAVLLLTMGGIAVLALTGRRGGGRVVVAAVTLPLLLVAVAALPAARPLWSALVLDLPGGGVLRDPQKLSAGWSVAGAVGIGALVDEARSRLGRQSGAAVGVLCCLVWVAVLPGAAWGLGGALSGTELPPDYAAAVGVLDAAPPGTVAVLPWQQYRRYAWNEGRVSLTVAPRLLPRQVLADDSLPVSGTRVPGEDPRSGRVRDALAAGADPATVLRAEGARYVFVEKGSTPVPDPSDLGVVLHDTQAAAVVDLGPAVERAVTPLWPVLTGWLVTAGTYLAVVGVALLGHGRPSPTRLLRCRA